jgi:hypothetical protein
MRAGQPEFHQHGIVARTDGDDLVGLVGKRDARSGKVAADGFLAVEHTAGAVELVARMGEGGDDAIPIALAFEPHVIAHELDT